MDKIDMSLDDIIKMEGISSGRGRNQKFQNKRGTKSNMANAMNRNRVLKAKLRNNRQAPFKKATRLPDKWQHDMFEGPSGRGTGSTHLLVSNLEYGVSDADIHELFAEFGNLIKASVHYDRSGRSLGTADVIFTNRNEANAAMKQYNGVPLDGRPMKITMVPTGNAKRGVGNAGVLRSNKFSTMMRGKNRARGPVSQGAQGGRRGLKRKTLTAEELDADLDAYVNK